MPGVINPHGRRDLGETTRIITRPFYGESDVQLGLVGGRGGRKSKNPYSKIKAKKSAAIIEMTWKLIFKMKREKGTIIKLLIDQYKIDSTASAVIYYKAFNKGSGQKTH